MATESQLRDEFKQLEDLMAAGINEQTGPTIMTSMKNFIGLILQQELNATAQLAKLEDEKEKQEEAYKSLTQKLQMYETQVESTDIQLKDYTDKLRADHYAEKLG